MKASELRIGNWIEWDDDSHEQFKVETIDYSEPNYFVNGGLLDDMLPITLTEEWLLKFGTWPVQWESKTYIVVSGIDSWIDIIRDSDGSVSQTPSLPCEYVHQLQNLYFALTGNELELK